MLFNSFSFVIFFPLVCAVYFILPYKYRWIFLLISSYYFYMNWQPVYAVLIFLSTLTTYYAGIKMDATQDGKKRKVYLIVNLFINVGILFLFKYYNFINTSVFDVLDYFGIRWSVPNFDMLLPVGISFYTFQAVGYSIDVYKGTLKAEKHFGIYALFVSFFPQLVAGPIERATNLLPQFREKFSFNSDRAISGLKQMLWGYFMKLVIADRVATYVNAAYNHVDNHTGTTLLLATVLFAIQIYCDFAGYSNIAIGAARVMGFTLMENFRRPYFSTSISDFWKRWHISLSTWFRDYVYIPLGGNRVKQSRHLFNLFFTFLLSGLWHGANWTFVLWGATHGLYLIGGVLKKRFFPSFLSGNPVKKWFDILVTFILVVFAWIFFRANTISDAFQVIHKIIFEQGSLFLNMTCLANAFVGISILFLKELKDEIGLNIHLSNSGSSVVRYGYAVGMVCVILLFGVFDGGQFIYFQF